MNYLVNEHLIKNRCFYSLKLICVMISTPQKNGATVYHHNVIKKFKDAEDGSSSFGIILRNISIFGEFLSDSICHGDIVWLFMYGELRS